VLLARATTTRAGEVFETALDSYFIVVGTTYVFLVWHLNKITSTSN